MFHFPHAGQVCLALSTAKAQEVSVRFFFLFSFNLRGTFCTNTRKIQTKPFYLHPYCLLWMLLSATLEMCSPVLYYWGCISHGACTFQSFVCYMYNSENFLKNNYGSNEVETCHVMIQSTCLHRPLFGFNSKCLQHFSKTWNGCLALQTVCQSRLETL